MLTADTYVEEVQLNHPNLSSLLSYLKRVEYLNIQKPTPKPHITTKEDLRKLKIPPNAFVSRTSGTTGEPVCVTKTELSRLWFNATNLRELRWRGWDLTKGIVSILAKFKEDSIHKNIYNKKIESCDKLQTFLESVQPDYLFTYPSILKELDLSKLQNLKDVKSVGEIGATSYSAEEIGTIALMCEKGNYHIMENIVLEESEFGVLITDLTNPIINRYAIGDIVKLSDEACKCGRRLSVITKIAGRVRGMLMSPDGNKVWPTIGEPTFSKLFPKIVKHQAIQKSFDLIVIKLMVTESLTKEEEDLFVKTVIMNLGILIEIKLEYVTELPLHKFQAFVCEV